MKSYKEKVNEKNRADSSVRLLTDDELKQLKQTLLDTYLDIQAVCQKHGLTCMLLGGSTLGAIRHKGFIPWDDDLDMGMPRDDYEKLKQIFKTELGEKYVLNGPNYEGIPTNRFSKILVKGTRFVEGGSAEDERSCIKVDIFIIENVPDNPIIKYVKGLRCTVLMFIGGHVLSYEGWKRKNKKSKLTKRQAIGALFSFRTSKDWFDRLDYAYRCGNKNSGLMTIPAGRKHYFGEMHPREVFLPASEASFEGKKVYLPANPDAYLKKLYGDYMTVPPEEKREHHYIKKISFGSAAPDDT